jgi:hypothetical protein
MKILLGLLALLLLDCNSSPSLHSTDGSALPHRVPAPQKDASRSSDGFTLTDLPQPTQTVDAFLDARPSDFRSDSLPDLIESFRADLLTDLFSDSQVAALPDLSPPDLLPDDVVSLRTDTKPDLNSPELPPNLPLGSPCSRPSACHSNFCTDGVCCEVEKCLPCVPTATSSCAPYAGYTCAPSGMCRGY